MNKHLRIQKMIYTNPTKTSLYCIYISFKQTEACYVHSTKEHKLES